MTSASRGIEVSVILPCYRAADIARESVDELTEVLDRCVSGRWEIIVVDDGGGDFSPEAWAGDRNVQLIRLPRNRGKGAAVRAGMAAAAGRARVYTDVDVPYDPLLIPVMARYLLVDGFHAVVGDRTLPDSSYRDDITLPRRVLSRLASTFVGTLVTGGFFDTQCGLKGLRGDVADLLFPMVHIDRFGFDVEVIYLTLRFNCDIKRIPVRLRRDRGPSTVRIFRDSIRAAIDILRIKRRAMLGRYQSAELEALFLEEFRARLRAVGAPPTRGVTDTAD